ncbi:MAG: DNA polymerase III subunit gamma/tau, partial [Elusimicrobia bacterium]|nr:DNA polymerase III subunit gamma/tau [Elusimicrobiota bacterium]
MSKDAAKEKSAHQVLARKHRPQGFDELVGQPGVSQTLKNALAAGRVHHAYLFTGPRGCGKTTTARILAKALNCEKGPTAEPCGTCVACREIAASSCLDVLEMDAASHTGVDNVREVIIETVALAPNRDRYKVFIIDETHMLSGAAFNALLKTIEEPPPHVVFILATTEAHKVPATIASRCQRFKFRPVEPDLLASHLAAIAKKEKIAVEPEALALLARAAEGSLRDAVGLLDQCRSVGEGKVELSAVREMFGFVPAEMLMGAARALLSRDAKALAGWLKKVYEEGVEPAQFLKDLRAAFEAVYLEKLGAGSAADPAWSKALSDATPEALGFLLRRLNRALEELRFGDSPRLALELGLFSALESAQDLGAWVERLEALERRLSAGGGGPALPAR